MRRLKTKEKLIEPFLVRGGWKMFYTETELKELRRREEQSFRDYFWYALKYETEEKLNQMGIFY